MSRLSAVIVLSLSLLLGGCRSVYFGALNLASDPTPRVAQSFAFDTAHALSLDVYQPDQCEQAPVLVFFYGGTWQNGERRWYRFIGEQFAAQGVVTVIPDYRKAPEAIFPTYVEDAAMAVAFVHAHAAEWCGDPKRVTVAGHSAGAHLAALLSIDSRYLSAHHLKPKQAIAGPIGLAGPYDFLPIVSDDLRVPFPDPKRDAETQPIRFVDGDEPSALLIHGMDDRLVWPRNSVNLAARLRDSGVASEFVAIEDIGHTRLLNQLGDRDDPNQVLARMLTFIHQVRSNEP